MQGEYTFKSWITGCNDTTRHLLNVPGKVGMDSVMVNEIPLVVGKKPQRSCQPRVQNQTLRWIQL